VAIKGDVEAKLTEQITIMEKKDGKKTGLSAFAF